MEILIKAMQANLRAKEMPIVMNYERKILIRNRIVRCLDVVLNTVKTAETGTQTRTLMEVRKQRAETRRKRREESTKVSL